MTDDQKIEIQNSSTGKTTRVDRTKYEAVRKAYLDALPAASPGLTSSEIKQQILPNLPEELFPGGAKVGWWQKAVQLDLEAKNRIVRETTSPLRFRKK